MPFDVIVAYCGAESVLTFDLTPTYDELCGAIEADVVSHARFAIVGTTMRGSQVQIKDQSSLTRVIGARHECSVTVTEQLSVQRSASPPRKANAVSAAAASASDSAGTATARRPPKMAATCDGVIDGLAAESRVSCAVGGAVWMVEKDAGRIAVRSTSDAAVLHVIAFSGATPAASVSCLCLLHVRCPGSGMSSATSVWAGMSNKRIAVFDVQKLAEAASLVEHSGAVTALTQVAEHVFSASTDFTILQWSAETRVAQKLFSGHRNAVRSLCSVKHRLASGGDDGAVILWNATTSESVFQIAQAHAGGIHALAFVAGILWSGGEDGCVKAWDSDSGALRAHHREHNGSVRQLLPLEQKLISVGVDKRLVMYDAATTYILGVMTHPHVVGPLNLVMTERRQLFRLWCAAGDKSLSLWKIEDAMPRALVQFSGRGGGEWPPTASDANDAAPSRSSSRRSISPTPSVSNALRSLPPPPPHQACSNGPSSELSGFLDVDAVSAGGVPPLSRTGSSLEAQQLAVVKLQVDERTLRQAVAADEARDIAELSLAELRARVARETVSMSADAFAATALELHAAALEISGLALRSAVQLGSGMLGGVSRTHSRHSTVTDRLVEGYRAEHEASTHAVTQLRGEVQELTAELQQMHAQYDTLLAAYDKRKLELETAHNTRRNAEDSLRRYQDESRSFSARNAQLQAALDDLAAQSSNERRGADVKLTALQEECDARIGAMQQKLHETESALEMAQRAERAAVAAAKDAKETGDVAVRRAEAKLAAALDEERRLSERLDADRELWKSQLRAADESYDGMKATLTGKIADHVAQLEKLQVECREAQHARRIAEDKLALAERRAALNKEDLDDECRRLKVQLSDAREGWKAEVSMLEQSLNEKSYSQQSTDAQVREKDAQLSEVRTANAALQRKLDAASSEMERVQSQCASHASTAEARIQSLEGFLASAKNELENHETLLQAERAARAEAEQHLQAAEENYEAVRRRHNDEMQTLHEEALRERSDIQQRLRGVEEGNAATIRELTQQVQLLQVQHEALEAAHRALTTDHDAATTRAATLQQQLNEEQRRRSSEAATLQRVVEARKAEIAALHERLERLGQRERELLETRGSECAELAAAADSMRAELEQLRADHAREQRLAEDAAGEAKRLRERLANERDVAQKRGAEAAAQLESARADNKATIAALDAKTAEADAALHTITELEALLRSVRDEANSADARFVATAAEKDDELRSTHAALRAAEATTQELRTFAASQHEAHARRVSELERDIEASVAKNRILSEEVAAIKQRSDASASRAAEQLEAKGRELQAMRVAHEASSTTAAERVTRAEAESETVRVELAEARRQLAAHEENTRHEQRAATEKLRLLQVRVDDVQLQLEAKLEEMADERKRHAAELAREQELWARRVDAAREGNVSSRSQVQREAEEARKQAQDAAAALRAAEHRIAALEDEQSELALRHASSLAAAKAETQEALVARDLIAKQQQRAREELDSAAQRVREECDRSSAALAAKAVELDSARAELDEVKKREAATRAELAELRRRAGDTDTELARATARAESDRSAHEERVRSLGEEISLLRGELLAAKSAVAASDDHRREAESHARDAESALARAASRATELEEKHASEISRHKAAAQALTVELEAAKAGHEQVRKECSDLRAKLEAAASELEAMQAECAGVTSTLDALTASARDTERQLTVEMETAHSRISSLEAELQDARAVEKDAVTESNTAFKALEATRAALERQKRETTEAAAFVQDLLAKAAAYFEALLELGSSDIAARAELTFAAAAVAVSSVHEQLRSAQEEVQRQTRDLVSTQREAERARSVSVSHGDLLQEVRIEMNNVYAKLKQECEDHDATRVELMALRSRLSSAARDDELQRATDVSYLRTVVASLEAEKVSLLKRLEVAHATSPSPRAPPNDSITGSPSSAFVLSTRRELLLHVTEIVHGIKEVARLTHRLGDRPPVIPDLETLVGVYEWLDSAVHRGDVILRTLLTEEEKRSLVSKQR